MELKKTVAALMIVFVTALQVVPAAAADGTDAEAPAEQAASQEMTKEYSKNIRGAVVTEKAVIHEETSADSPAVMTLKFGDKVVVKKGNGKWYKVTRKDKAGYIKCSKVVRYNKTKKHVAITFDDGPGARTTKVALRALRKNKCRATFFVLGSCINRSTKKLIKQEYELGCEIGNHSYSHPKLKGLSYSSVKSQMARTDRKVKAITGKKPTVCRAPYGAYNKKVLKAMARPNIFWSVDTLDWKHRNTKRLIRVVTKGTKDGDIVLMHDIHPTTTAAVNSILKNLKKKGFEMVTVTELAAIKGKSMKKGHSYSRF